MYKQKLLLIVMIIIVLLVLLESSGELFNSYAKAERGIMDLTRLQFKNDTVKLDGEWEFYWNQLIDPDEIDTGLMTGYIVIPSSWNKHTASEDFINGDGFATYRMTFITDENGRLALKMPRLHTAYKLWLNGKLSAAAGTVGKTKDTMIPQYLPQIIFFDAKQGNNEILIQVSNFHHRSGGILESIRVGSEKQILALRYNNIAKDFLLFGCLIFIGVYHLALFFFRRKNTSALYFGSFCVLIGIRTLLVGECFLIYIFPGFNWEIAHKIMTMTYYFGVPLILMFFMSIFPKYFNARVIKTSQIMGITFGALIILTPARVFTVANPLYQIWTIIAIIYIFNALINIFINREKDSWIIILGASAFLLCTINDIIFTSIWMNDNGYMFLKHLFRTGNLSSVGQFIFAVANSLLLSKKFSDSLKQEEIITKKLTEINSNLDKIVLQRTEALIESNEKIEQQKLELEKANRQLQKLSLKDPLTSLWNRRKYDEAINLEWNRCLRHQRAIALVFMDIDYFKEYNDYYGHLAGDECLTMIGQTIMDSLLRSTDMAARYGGEEFVLILSETGKEEAIKIAEMLRQKIESLHILHEQSPVSSYITVSIGVAFTIPSINSTHEDLFNAADKALYKAKANGRNQVKFFS